MTPKIDFVAAHERIRAHVRETPLDASLALSELCEANVYVKCENLQYTGSFKLRGATNKIRALSTEQLARGVVTASSGNHGAGVAHALRALDARGIVFVPQGASPTKIANIQRYGAEVRTYGTDGVDTEIYARQFAEQNGMTYVSPYNDAEVVAGQGTIGVEIVQQLPNVDAVLIAVGGGGLIGGIAAYLKSVAPRIRIVGCQPQNSAVMARSVQAGHIIEEEGLPTLSDGTYGGVESDSITFELCQKFVDEFVLVSEDEIAAAMRTFIDAHHMLIEGAAGVAIAALLKQRGQYIGKNVVVVLCGANISREKLKAVL